MTLYSIPQTSVLKLKIKSRIAEKDNMHKWAVFPNQSLESRNNMNI